jgi:prenyltransferase beta subunit
MQTPLFTRRRVLGAGLLGIVWLQAAARSAAQTPMPEAGADWLIARQNRDGGFGAAPGVSDIDTTADVLIALAAAGRLTTATRWPARRSPLRYLRAQVRRPATAPPAKWVLALSAAGEDPRRFGGIDFVAEAERALADAIGKPDANPRTLALSIRALRRAGTAPNDDALRHLASLRIADGGWRVDPSTPSDPATTAIVLRGLAGSEFGTKRADADAAIAYLKSVQNADGGFARAWRRGPTNAVSTALALQALDSIGAQPDLLSASNGNPLTALSALRGSDGAFALSAGQGPDLLATASATAALLRR